jgi:L-asparaginase II
MNAPAILAHEYRNETLDLTRYGYLVIVDERSKVIFSAGEACDIVFFRSSSKPIQALPVIARSLDAEYGLTDEETAIFAASHAGETFHVAALERITKKAGLSESMFLMEPTGPGDGKSEERRIRAGQPLRKFYHNCSGKHAALILTQRALGGAPADYWKLGQPVQLEVERTIKAVAETDTLQIAIDGCGVPVFAATIKNIAIAYKNLACIDTIKDGALQSAAARFIPRMHKYPHMISGTGKLCTLLNKDENIIAKGGANGVYGFALKSQRIGVALKCADGTDRAWPLLILETLRALGALTCETEKNLESFKPSSILNDNGVEVGRRTLAFNYNIG